MTSEFNIGDKIMGIHSMYHDDDKPFYGEITEIKSDCGAYYYGIRGKYPFPNKLTEDGCQLIWAWEKCLDFYDNDRCVEAFIKYMEIDRLEKGIRKLQKEIEAVIIKKGRCEICGRRTENNPSDVQFNNGSMGKKVMCDACMSYIEPTPSEESMEMLRT